MREASKNEGTRNTLYVVGIVVAILISTGLGWSIYSDASHSDGLNQREAQERAGDYSERANIAAKGRCADLPPPAQTQCVAEEREAARPSERYEYDLEAQRTMAAWTRAMGMAAIVAMSVGIVGVGLVFVTFYETRRAATASADSAKHAATSARAAVAQHRAWLKVTDISVTKLSFKKAENREGQPEYISAAVYVHVQNVGTTPATNVEMGVCVWALTALEGSFEGWRESWNKASAAFASKARIQGDYGFVLFPDDAPLKRGFITSTLASQVPGSLTDTASTDFFRLFGVVTVLYTLANGDPAKTLAPFVISLPSPNMLTFDWLREHPEHDKKTISVTRHTAGDRAI